jgi:hypothetical protein
MLGEQGAGGRVLMHAKVMAFGAGDEEDVFGCG